MLNKCIVSVLLLLMLTACGQKGPLFVPDEPEVTAKERIDGYYKRY